MIWLCRLLNSAGCPSSGNWAVPLSERKADVLKMILAISYSTNQRSLAWSFLDYLKYYELLILEQDLREFEGL